jgi:hypothetical protein
MASGTSAAMVSRIGLPLSQVSAVASSSRFCLHPVGDLQQDIGAFGGRGIAPAVLGGMGGIQRRLDILGAERAIWPISAPVMGVVLVKYLPDFGATHLPPMKLS